MGISPGLLLISSSDRHVEMSEVQVRGRGNGERKFIFKKIKEEKRRGLRNGRGQRGKGSGVTYVVGKRGWE